MDCHVLIPCFMFNSEKSCLIVDFQGKLALMSVVNQLVYAFAWDFLEMLVDWWENVQETLIFPAKNRVSSAWFSLKPLVVEMKSTIKASRETPTSERVHCLPFSLNVFNLSTWHSKIPQINEDSAFLQSGDMLQNFARFIALDFFGLQQPRSFWAQPHICFETVYPLWKPGAN